MDKDLIITNILKFVCSTIIPGGYGYDYQLALKYLLNGEPYDKVYSWYNKQITEGGCLYEFYNYE